MINVIKKKKKEAIITVKWQTVHEHIVAILVDEQQALQK